MNNIFTKHPKEVGESYINHFFKALSFSALLFSLGFKALVHALLPFCFETTVSAKVKTLSAGMQKRREEAQNN